VAHAPGAWLFLVVAAALGASQPDPGLTPEVLLLARIKLRMKDNLERLPNYTCRQTIERSERLASSRRFRLVDAIRLEVALVGGKELFAWPGESSFQDRDIAKLVTGGAIGNGDFALHARSVFLGRDTRFRYAGKETMNGREAIRFDYEVPLASSGFTIRMGALEAQVAYFGSFWVDPATLDAIRLDVKADKIPPFLQLSSTSDRLEYARVPIGGQEFLLPSAADLSMIDLRGNENRNRTTFAGCRQFSGESTLSFAEPLPDSGPARPAPAIREVRLPPDLDLDLELETPIDSQTAASGDPLRARLASPVKKRGETLLPKGAIFSGRLLKLQRRAQPPGIEVELEFDFAEAENVRSAINARLEDMLNITNGLRPLGTNLRLQGAVRLVEPQNPGASAFFARVDRLRLPRGMRMRWRTVEPVAPEPLRNP
jgi:hypothetical protein